MQRRRSGSRLLWAKFEHLQERAPTTGRWPALRQFDVSSADGCRPSDATDEWGQKGWVFLCSSEQLPDASFHARVRQRLPPTNEICTLDCEEKRFSSARRQWK